MSYLDKILVDVSPQTPDAAYKAMHLTMAQGEFRRSFTRMRLAAQAYAEGDHKTGKAYELAAQSANDRGDLHLSLAMEVGK